MSREWPFRRRLRRLPPAQPHDAEADPRAKIEKSRQQLGRDTFQKQLGERSAGAKKNRRPKRCCYARILQRLHGRQSTRPWSANAAFNTETRTAFSPAAGSMQTQTLVSASPDRGCEGCDCTPRKDHRAD